MQKMFWPAEIALVQKGISRQGLTMALLVTGEALLSAVKDETFLKGGSEKCAEGVKYDLRMGSQLLRAGKNPVNMRALPENELSELSLGLGEMAFVLTEETLDLPRDMVAVLSPKRKLSHEGILVLGGFLIDPLYCGNLLVGLYNFSSTRWPLRPGRKLIAVAFYSLVENELAEFPKPEAIVEFPDELVRVMRNYSPATVGGLQDLINQTQKDLIALRQEFREQEDWKKTFCESLDRHDAQIVQLLSGIKDLSKSLADERINRLTREAVVNAELGQMATRSNRRFTWWVTVITAIIAAVIGALLWPTLQHIFSKGRTH
jgi:deoxycytidine triphosphate deaminase